MARRSTEWNEGLAKDLREPEFASQFLLASLDEGLPLHVALGKIIRAYGVKEYSKKVRMPSPHLLRATHRHANPTLKILQKLLKPLGLRLGAIPTSK